MASNEKKSFLEELLAKRAMVEQLGASTGKNVDAARSEVDRQLKQCMTGGNITKGATVTKSGEED